MQSQKSDPGKKQLNVIALISGGKDSLYSLLHCLANGHNIVALANLHPPGDGAAGHALDEDQDQEGTEEEDMNSYMYQTIGHSVIPLYEEALGIPLYRAPITGSAVYTGRVYPPLSKTETETETGTGTGTGTGTEGKDETEALIPLLQKVQTNHPEVNALSTGAILSTYQRTRVESVASRLGLVSLSWLWMYPYLPPSPSPGIPTQGMDERETGLLDDMATCTCETRIIKVASGGLDQSDLWTNITSSSDPGPRRRILRRMQRFTDDARAAVLGEGGEYESLALDGPGFLWKKRIQVDQWSLGLDGQGVSFRGVGSGSGAGKCVDRHAGRREIGVRDVPRPGLFDAGFLELLHGLDQSIDDELSPETKPDSRETAKQMLDIKQSLQTDNIAFATVLLRSMDDFTPMNDIYATLFPNPNPPARVTVACDLPAGVNVQVAVEYGPDAQQGLQGLHVQSRSYWAPANIGPYSQSISIPLPGTATRLVYVAGQIPLDPASMEIVRGSYTTRAVLALQHLWRIAAAMQVNWWVCAVAYVTASRSGEAKARLAWDLWDRMHVRPEDKDEDDVDVDIWDIKYGGQGPAQQPTASLPDFSLSLSDTTPPFLAVQVAGLPRGTDIEWQGLGCHCATGVDISTTTADTTTTTTIEGLTSGVIEIGMEHADHLQEHMQDILDKYSSYRLVVYTAHTQTLSCTLPRDTLVIPCRGVWGKHAKRIIAGIRFSSQPAIA